MKKQAILNDFRQRVAAHGTPESVAICYVASRYGVKPDTVRRLVRERRQEQSKRISYKVRKSTDYPGMSKVIIYTDGGPITWHTKTDKEGIEALVNRYRDRIAT